MSLLLDSCVPRLYVRLLHEWGYDASLSTAYIAADAVDADVLKLAQTLDAVLLTFDLDFANVLTYSPVIIRELWLCDTKPQMRQM